MDSFVVALNHTFCSPFRWIIERKEITLKLFLGEKFQCGKNSFVVIGIGSAYFLFIFEQRSYIFNNLAPKMPDLKEESIVAVPLIQSPSVTFEE